MSDLKKRIDEHLNLPPNELWDELKISNKLLRDCRAEIETLESICQSNSAYVRSASGQIKRAEKLEAENASLKAKIVELEYELNLYH